MNMNETSQTFGRGRGRGRGCSLKVIPIQSALMKPPRQPARKTKANSTFSASSSNINWRSRSNSSRKNSSAHPTSPSTWTRSSTESESQVIVALSEGRGEAFTEVGIAAINVSQAVLILCQISDTQSYVNTLTKINILNPTEILIPLTFVDSITLNRLVDKLKHQFKNVKITGLNRSSFNKNIGTQYVKHLCVANMNSVLLVLQHRYYALAAAAALLSYVETKLCVIYSKESIKIEYQESEGYAIIDVTTADRLELVANTCAIKKKYSCLLDILNYCYTKVGALSLRASILQPPCLVADIEARLDCVTALIEHREMLTAIQIVLQKLTKIDQLLSLATILPDDAQNCSERQLNYLLLLNSVLEQIPFLQDVFENSTQPYFAALKTTLNDPAFIEIKEILRRLINTDAHPAKGKYGIIQRCFAIKSGVNYLLDLVRKSYSERLDEMREYVKHLGEQYKLSLTLNNTQQKGYHIVLTLNAYQKRTLKKSELPDEFIQVDRLSNSFTMKTQALINLSSRVEDINLEILKMSNIMIHKVLIAIRERIGIFYSLCENISKLDMIQALAQASNNMHYVRPKFSNYLEVVQGRHPLLNFLHPVEPVANTLFASEDYNMNIITGPNGSGKSIFIRQVVLLQIMAQVGCYVPAESATFRVADRILARVCFGDNMTCGASAFAVEMKEIQYFLTVLTKNTIIIVDELCRSTSIVEGTAIAMAICERLMKTPAFVFFTTHFKLLTTLYDLHINVKLWKMETLTEVINDQMILRFTYNIIPGVTSLEHYGLFLAKVSWPENIIRYAQSVLNQLSPPQKTAPAHGQVQQAVRLKYDLEANFKLLKTKGKLTVEVINKSLAEYKVHLQELGHFNPVFNDIPIPHNDGFVDIFQTANNTSFLNITGNICDYYNTEKANTSYQDLSQEFSMILQEKMGSEQMSRKIFDDFENNEEIPEAECNYWNNLSTQQTDRSLNFNLEYESADQNNFFTNYVEMPYNPIFEPEIMIQTEDELQLNFSKESVTNQLIAYPEKTFSFNKSASKIIPSALHETVRNVSYESINEFKFSLPLQQNVDRTSTPITNTNQNRRFQYKRKEICFGNLEQPKQFGTGILNGTSEVDGSVTKKFSRKNSNTILWQNDDFGTDDSFESAVSTYLDSFEAKIGERTQNTSQQETENDSLNQWKNVNQHEDQSKKSTITTTGTTSSSIKWLGKQNECGKNNAAGPHQYLQKSDVQGTKTKDGRICTSKLSEVAKEFGATTVTSSNWIGNQNTISKLSSDSMVWKNKEHKNSMNGSTISKIHDGDAYDIGNQNIVNLQHSENLYEFKKSSIGTSSVNWLENNNYVNNTIYSPPSVQNTIKKNRSSHSFNVTSQSYVTDAEMTEITKDLQSISECFSDSDDWVVKESKSIGNNKTKNLSQRTSSDSSLDNEFGGYQMTVVVDVHPVVHSKSKISPKLTDFTVKNKDDKTRNKTSTQKINTLDEIRNVDDATKNNDVTDKISLHSINLSEENLNVCQSRQELNFNVLNRKSQELFFRKPDLINPEPAIDNVSKNSDLRNAVFIDNLAAISSVKPEALNLLQSSELFSKISTSSDKSTGANNHTDQNGKIQRSVENDASLEPLGDIHLELFSDQSMCEETNLQNDNTSAADSKTAKSISQSSSTLLVSPTITNYSKTKYNSEKDFTKPDGLPKSKKRKWNPPYKNQDVNTNSNETDIKTMSVKKSSNSETEEDVNVDDDIENRLKEIMNRPTFKQVQQLECIATIQKSGNGVIVKKTVKPKKKKFIPPTLKRKSEEFDMTLFSDKNVQKFEDYMHSSTKSPLFVRSEMTSFQFTGDEVGSKQIEAPMTFDEDLFSNFGRNIQNFQSKTLQKYRDISTVNSQDLFDENESANPGYYTQNKETIDNLVDKYLNKSDNCQDYTINNSQKKLQNETCSSSIYSQATLELSKN